MAAWGAGGVSFPSLHGVHPKRPQEGPTAQPRVNGAEPTRGVGFAENRDPRSPQHPFPPLPQHTMLHMTTLQATRPP